MIKLPTFLRKRTVVVDCYTWSKPAAELFYIRKFAAARPDWYDGVSSKSRTIKNCRGLKQLMATSFVMPETTEAAVKCTSSGDGTFNFDFDFREQTVLELIQPDTMGEEYWERVKGAAIFKRIVPWRPICDEPIDFMVHHNSWYPSGPFFPARVVTGILDFKYNHATNYFLHSPLQDGLTYNIPPASSMTLLTPLTDKRVEFRCHFDPDKWKLLDDETANTPYLVNNYIKHRRLMEKENKCRR